MVWCKQWLVDMWIGNNLLSTNSMQHQMKCVYMRELCTHHECVHCFSFEVAHTTCHMYVCNTVPVCIMYILVILPLSHNRGPVGLNQDHWRQHPWPYVDLTTRQCPQSSSLPTGRADEEKHQWCLQECSGRTGVSSRTRPRPPRYQGCVLYSLVCSVYSWRDWHEHVFHLRSSEMDIAYTSLTTHSVWYCLSASIIADNV